MQKGWLAALTGIICILALVQSSWADDVWTITVTGPDGDVMVDNTVFESAVEENGVTWDFDDENSFSGLPLWRVVRMADLEKTAGPGDIVVITGLDKKTEIPYPAVYKKDHYLIVNQVNNAPVPEQVMGNLPGWPVMYVSPTFPDGTQVGGIESITLLSTDTWELGLVSGDETKSLSQEAWEVLLAMKGMDVNGPEGFTFTGIPLYELIESEEFFPAEDATIVISGQDGYSTEIPWSSIDKNEGYVLVSEMNGETLPKYIKDLYPEVSTPAWPLILIDPGFPSMDQTVGNVEKIEIVS